jgi:hypothetical protein
MAACGVHKSFVAFDEFTERVEIPLGNFLDQIIIVQFIIAHVPIPRVLLLITRWTAAVKPAKAAWFSG